MQRSDSAFLAVKLIGGIYMPWLGVQAIRHRHDLAAALDAREALIIFGAVLPRFVNRSAGHVQEQMLLLSLVSFGTALISDSLWAVAASTVRSWFAGNPRRLAAVGGAGGLAMIGVEVSVAVTGRRD